VTALELVACVMITVRFSLDITGVFENCDYSDPTAVVFYILLYRGTLITLGLNRGMANLVVITVFLH